MTANDNRPLGKRPWQLTAAAPGTLNVRVDVEDPVEWEVGASSNNNQARLTEPLCSPYPVLTTRGSVQSYKGTFTLFIPDSQYRDTVVDAIIAAPANTDVPYYIWRTVDGTQSWRVLFDSQQKISVGFLQGHRTVKVSFIQISTGDNLTVGDFPGSVPISINTQQPSVTCPVLYAYRGEPIPVRWANVPFPDPGDFIGLFLSNNSTNLLSDTLGYTLLGGAAQGHGFVPSAPALDTSLAYEFRLIGINKLVVNGPFIVMKQATLNTTLAVNGSNWDVTYTWDTFDSADPPAQFVYGVPGLTPIFTDNISGTTGSHTHLNVPITDFRAVPQIVLLSGRKVIGPLS